MKSACTQLVYFNLSGVLGCQLHDCVPFSEAYILIHLCTKFLKVPPIFSYLSEPQSLESSGESSDSWLAPSLQDLREPFQTEKIHLIQAKLQIVL